MNILTAVVFVCTTWTVTSEVPPIKYTHYDEMIYKLDTLSKGFPELAKWYTLSETSVSGRDLFVMQISTDVGAGNRKTLKPMVKYIANMHGNEAIGREMMLAFVEHILTSYKEGKDQDIIDLVENTDIHVMPTMNPDGFERSNIGQCSGYDHQSGRTNNNEVDLNRNFPTWDDLGKTREEILDGPEPETRALMRLILDNKFVLSVNFHDGAVVANYPYDDSDGPANQPSKTPDDDVFIHLSKAYADNHKYMHQGVGLCEKDNFTGGITNGADWYVVRGGMQDFNYLFSNAFEITVEMSCCKYPLEDSLPLEWENNKKSLVKYLLQSHIGIKGIVTKYGEAVENAKVVVEGRSKAVFTTENGEFWRLLVPGNYKIYAVDTKGFVSDIKDVTLDVEKPLQRVDLELSGKNDSLSFELPMYMRISAAKNLLEPSVIVLLCVALLLFSL